jgi:hypothetical protein
MLGKEDILNKMADEMPYYLHLCYLPYIKEAMEIYATQDKWISAKELPDAKEVGKKVLLFREMNEGQREMAITVYDTFLVKHCDPETTFWQPLPNPPKQ